MDSIWAWVRMSTGTAFSASVPAAREPTVTSSWKPRPSAKSWLTLPGESVTLAVRGRIPPSRP